jgi:hypothetical protein
VEKTNQTEAWSNSAMGGVYLAVLTAFSKTTLKINAGNLPYDFGCTLANCLAQTTYDDLHELGD